MIISQLTGTKAHQYQWSKLCGPSCERQKLRHPVVEPSQKCLLFFIAGRFGDGPEKSPRVSQFALQENTPRQGNWYHPQLQPSDHQGVAPPRNNSACVDNSQGPFENWPLTTTTSWSKNGWKNKSTVSNLTSATELAAITGWTSSLFSRMASKCTKRYLKKSLCVTPFMEDSSYRQARSNHLSMFWWCKESGVEAPRNCQASRPMTLSLGPSE